MVLPEKLVRVGLGLGSFLPSTAPDVGAASHEVLKLRDLGGLVGPSTTDLVRFSSTLKVARAIVEEHRRAKVIEVPTSSLVSILDRIQALEKEVEDLLNGKKVNKDSKAIETLESGPASGDSVSSSPTSSSPAYSPDGGSSGKSSDGSSGGSSGSSSGGKSSSSSASSSDGGSDSSSSSSNKNSASGSNSSGGSTSTHESELGSTGGLTTEENDCAPEHLLYRLGGGSVQRRSVIVSEHPLFRRNTNCTLDSVSGGPKGKNLPSGAAVFKEDSSSATADGASPASGDGSADRNDGTADKSDTKSDTAKSDTAKSDTKSDADKSDTKSDTAKSNTTNPATDKSTEKSADKLTDKSGDESDDKSAALESQSAAPSSASADGSAAKQDGASLALTSPPSATTAAHLGSKAKGSAAESEEETTITTTMTSTSYTTVTIHRRPSSIKAGLDGKYANTTASISAPASAGHLFKNGTAISTAMNTPPSPAALFFTGVTGSASSPSATEKSSAGSGNYSSATADGVRAESTTAGSGQIFFENNSTAPQPEAVVSPSWPASVGDVSTSFLQTVSSLASADSTAAVAEEKVPVSPATVTSTTTYTTTITIVPAGSAVKKPEATTSALATDSNGALVKRRSGFQTVRTLRRRTADADEDF